MCFKLLSVAALAAGIVCGLGGRPIASRAAAGEKAGEESVKALAQEVGRLGWIVFCARSEQGDWDLFATRPDGSGRRNLTRTPDYNEAAPQVSRDGRRLLYRRLGRRESIDGNHYGTQGELMLADADGSNPVPLGKPGEYSWASWSPDGKQIACLSIKGISLVDVETRQVVRTMPRKGFFQQLTWSPDGKWFCGVANSFGTEWTVARMELASGQSNAVSRVACCTPDWFPDSRQLIFSSRPPGQKINNGYGWTQLWRADAEGKVRQLVYGEDGRHVYGGNVSPDGKYVLFTGNLRENGDAGNSGGPMGLVRLADTPIIGGASKELRTLHPDAKSGPVLVLPDGWEPCWTSAEIVPDQSRTDAGSKATTTPVGSDLGAVAALRAELRDRGWIVYSAPCDRGDWDLFVTRPDGSDRRRITDTPEFHEAGARFSPDGARLLYYRIPKTEAIDNNTYGTYELVVARSDGSEPVVLGKDFPWASWGPDGRQVACLVKGGIQIVDLQSRKVVRQLPRKGIVQQLVWSPDGRWFTGTANGLGPYWNIGRLSVETGQLTAVSETERYNCTPDWMPDSARILYARGIVPETGGFAEMWVASGDGSQRQMVCAEAGRHLYGACSSPDGKYLLFTRSEADLGKVDNSRTRMAIIRWKDTPMVLGGGDMRAKHPGAARGPVVDLSWGWEPHWTQARLP